MSTGLAVAVNYATGGDRSAWMWVTVAVLTVGVFAASLWAQRAQSAPAAAPDPLPGLDIADAETVGAMRFKGIRGVIARRLRADEMSFEEINTGRGDASHP
ncbi:hypothetical protein [Nocardia sp. NPDC050793]|uniref:hypothetical protein n=1 Tax=Nocardia sp. NPDC050793 TaxID=3155159 RepID=UPI0033E4EE44